MKIKCLFLFAFVFLPFQLAFADEASQGIVYLCDTDRKLFSLASIFEAADRIGYDAIYTAIPLSGHSRIVSSDSLECVIGDTTITAHIRIIPPRPTGACGGIEHITITSLQINGEEIIGNLSFSLFCADYSATDIEIKLTDNKTVTKICYRDYIYNHTPDHCDTFSK